MRHTRPVVYNVGTSAGNVRVVIHEERGVDPTFEEVMRAVHVSMQHILVIAAKYTVSQNSARRVDQLSIQGWCRAQKRRT